MNRPKQQKRPMKLTQKNTLLLVAFIVFALIICSAGLMIVLNSDKLNLSSMTTVNRCSDENMVEEARQVGNLVHEFEDVKFIAIYTNKEQLVSPILKMQEIRYEVEDLDLPYCLDGIEKASINYMNSVIIYMTHHMAGMDAASVKAEFNASEDLLAIYKEEYARFTGTEYVQPTSIPTTMPVVNPTTAP